MTQISPKIIDVEGNRIEYEKDDHVVKFMWKETDKSDSLFYGNQININENGRFPTQLFVESTFTNIKNKQYKYVKNIT